MPEPLIDRELDRERVYVFVGGPKHGELEAVPYRGPYRYMEMGPINWRGDLAEEPVVSEKLYYPEKFAGPGAVLHYMRQEDLSQEESARQVWAMLLERAGVGIAATKRAERHA